MQNILVYDIFFLSSKMCKIKVYKLQNKQIPTGYQIAISV